MNLLVAYNLFFEPTGLPNLFMFLSSFSYLYLVEFPFQNPFELYGYKIPASIIFAIITVIGIGIYQYFKDKKTY